ncbi:MAG: isoaspartyl peptidase/L-asparaginase [Bacteroidota bacterium]
MIVVEPYCRPPGHAGPMLLVHGGAWNIPDVECDAHLAGLQIAVETGKNALQAGNSALQVVAEVVAHMEGDGAFDAGCGAVLTRSGKVELDAGIMDGTARHFGSVAGIQHFRHPIKIALSVLENGGRTFCFLSGAGAEKFADASGFSRVKNENLVCLREQQRYDSLAAQAAYHTSHPFLADEDVPRGTVGCVAIDQHGKLAAATSTGGTPFRPDGRVGDSPMPGAGFYASPDGAASATGWGEAIASVSMCFAAVQQLSSCSAEDAAEAAIRTLGLQIKNEDGQGATGGIILLSATGEGGFAFSTPRMARGGWYAGGDPWVRI